MRFDGEGVDAEGWAVADVGYGVEGFTLCAEFA